MGKEELEEMEKLNPKSRHEIEEEWKSKSFFGAKRASRRPPKTPKETIRVETVLVTVTATVLDPRGLYVSA